MLTAWNAFPTLDRLFDDVMSDVTGTALGAPATARAAFNPAIDVRANADEILFVCDVPGIKQDDLDITVEGDTLTIKGKRLYDGHDKDKVWLGRSFGAFQRAFTLPDNVSSEEMTASLADGVLTIRVPKKPQAKPRRITIGGGSSKQLSEST